MNVSEILAKYPGLPTDLRAQLSAELAGMERDAGRYRGWLRDRLAIEDVEYLGDMPGHEPNEDESAKTDTAIDAAMTKGK